MRAIVRHCNQSKLKQTKQIQETKAKGKEIIMCNTNEISRPNTGRLQKMLRTALSAVVLALLCSLPAMRASAQTCIKCPTDAQSPAIADAFDVFTTRNGQEVRVTGQQVGACETLILRA